MVANLGKAGLHVSGDPKKELHSMWTTSENVESQIHGQFNSITEADEESALLFPDASAVVTRETDSHGIKRVTRAYFLTANQRCYSVKYMTIEDDFEVSLPEFKRVSVEFIP
jgi:hypothetical protein